MSHVELGSEVQANFKIAREGDLQKLRSEMLANIHADIAATITESGLGTDHTPFPTTTLYDLDPQTGEVALTEKELIRVDIPTSGRLVKEVGYLNQEGVLHLVRENEGDSSDFHHAEEARFEDYTDPRINKAIETAIFSAAESTGKNSA